MTFFIPQVGNFQCLCLTYCTYNRPHVLWSVDEISIHNFSYSSQFSGPKIILQGQQPSGSRRHALFSSVWSHLSNSATCTSASHWYTSDIYCRAEVATPACLSSAKTSVKNLGFALISSISELSREIRSTQRSQKRSRFDSTRKGFNGYEICRKKRRKCDPVTNGWNSCYHQLALGVLSC